MILPGSYANGFAPRDGRPLYPELWRGCVGAWAPCLGPTGLTLRDWSGYGRHADLTLRTAENTWIAQSSRYAMLFSGSNTAEPTSTQGRVVISRDLAAVSMGFACWLRPASLSKRGICTSGPDQSVPSFAITLLTTGALEVYRGANTTSSTTISAGAWSHIFVWNDSVNTSYWINGVFSNTAAQVASPALQSQFFIGANYWGAFDGHLDDARIYYARPADATIRLLASRRGIAYELASRRRASVAVAFNRRRRLLVGAHS